MTFYTEDHEAYRATARAFIQREVLPHYDTWEAERLVDRKAWRSAAESGLLGIAVDEEHGGAGVRDYRFRCVFAEEIARVGVTSFGAGLAVQDDIVIPYLAELGTTAQKQRWLTGLTSGELIGAIAMTEPGAGSDLQGTRATAVRDGDDWVINGQKTFITNGIQCDVVIVLARTDPEAGSRGFTLFVVEDGQEGFERGRKLEKVGLAGQDTAELFFDNVRVTQDQLLGEPGRGLGYLMERLPLERMSIAVSALVAGEASYAWTLEHVFGREAFGQRIGDFQNTRFALAEIETELQVTRAYIEQCVLRLNDQQLSPAEAAKAKWWATELQLRVTNRCLQLFGGYGYMLEYPIARAYRDARIQTIYGGTTEIMKEIIGREIAGRTAAGGHR